MKNGLRLALAAALALGACHTTDAPHDDYEAALAKWRAAKPDVFTYELTRSCYCPLEYTGPFLVDARKDSVLRVRLLTYDSGLVDVKKGLEGYSLDSLFADVKRNLDERQYSQKVWYNATYGFPDSAWFDYSENGADDEFGFRVRDFGIPFRIEAH